MNSPLIFSPAGSIIWAKVKFIYSESFFLKRPNALWSRTIGCRGKRRRLPVWKGAMSCNRLSCRFSCSGKAAFHCGECMDEKYGRAFTRSSFIFFFFIFPHTAAAPAEGAASPQALTLAKKEKVPQPSLFLSRTWQGTRIEL